MVLIGLAIAGATISASTYPLLGLVATKDYATSFEEVPISNMILVVHSFWYVCSSLDVACDITLR